MTSISKNVALLMGLAAIASVSTVYALMQDASSQNGVQAEHGKFLGHVTLALYGPDGNIKAYRQTDNLVTSTGDNATALKMFFGTNAGRKLPGCTGCTATQVGTFQFVGVGDNNAAVDQTQTALSHQISSKKLAAGAVGSVTNGTGGRGTAQIQVTFPANRLTNSSAASIVEAGLFDAYLNNTATNMFARQIFSAISVNTADTLQITWTISIQ